MINAGKRKALIQRRKTALMSQYDAAIKLGISQSQYSLIENGYYNPTEEQAKTLIQLFGLDNDYFNSGATAVNGGA